MDVIHVNINPEVLTDKSCCEDAGEPQWGPVASGALRPHPDQVECRYGRSLSEKIAKGQRNEMPQIVHGDKCGLAQIAVGVKAAESQDSRSEEEEIN